MTSKTSTILFVLTFVYQSISYANDFPRYKVDSILQVIDESSDSIKSDAYYQLGRLYVLYDSVHLAIPVLKRGVNYSNKLDNHFNTGKLYEYLGMAYDINGQLDSSLYHYNSAKKWHSKVPNNDESLNLIDINIGVAYYFASEYGNALKYYIEALEDAKRINNKDHIGKLLNNIAVIYRRTNKLDDALKYYKESLGLKRTEKDKIGEATTLQNIGSLFSYHNKIDSTIFYFERAKIILEKVDAPTFDKNHLDLSLAEAYYKTNNNEEAYKILAAFNQANFVGLKKENIIQGKMMLADIYYLQGNYQQSLHTLLDVKSDIGTQGFYSEFAEVHKYLARSYKAIGQYKNSIEAMEQYIAVNDSLHSEDKLILESEMLTKYNTLQKEKDIETLNLTQELKNTQINRQQTIIGIGISALALLGFLLYRLSRQYETIAIQKNSIKLALDDKELLLKEIHHRVKNNLQVISSLLSIQSRKTRDETAKEALNESKSRVHSMALIHQNLYKGNNSSGVKADHYIKSLCQDLLKSFGVYSGRVNIIENIEPLFLDIETIIPLGLIINELVTNALKYAFPNGREGLIAVSLSQNENVLELKVSDNGIGLSDDQTLVSRDGFGHSLISAFSQKLDCTFDLQSSPGTTVSLYINAFKIIDSDV